MWTLEEAHKKKKKKKKKPCDRLRWFKFKRCHIVKKMSKSQTHGLWRRFTKNRKKIDIMRFTHIDIYFDIKYEGHQNCSKTLSMYILMVFCYHHM